MKKETPETPILRAVCEYLKAEGHYFFRINNIPVYDPRIKVFRAMPKYSVKGVSDIVVLAEGNAYFIEIKVPKTATTKKTYQSKDQKQFEKDLTKNGIFYLVARGVEDVEDYL